MFPNCRTCWRSCCGFLLNWAPVRMEQMCAKVSKRWQRAKTRLQSQRLNSHPCYAALSIVLCCFKILYTWGHSCQAKAPQDDANSQSIDLSMNSRPALSSWQWQWFWIWFSTLSDVIAVARFWGIRCSDTLPVAPEEIDSKRHMLRVDSNLIWFIWLVTVSGSLQRAKYSKSACSFAFSL